MMAGKFMINVQKIAIIAKAIGFFFISVGVFTPVSILIINTFFVDILANKSSLLYLFLIWLITVYVLKFATGFLLAKWDKFANKNIVVPTWFSMGLFTHIGLVLWSNLTATPIPMHPIASIISAVIDLGLIYAGYRSGAKPLSGYRKI